MSLRFKHLRLRVETGQGRFGTDIPLSDGLMVIRADNSRGKSTSVQSILFALGLERMITTRPTQALTSAMRDRLIFDAASKGETSVLSSWVTLEIENSDGEAATLTRWVKDDRIDSGLVRVAQGPQITRPGDYPVQDFYVGRKGAVGNPRGFHRWLAEFADWIMPDLPAADGRLSPLYMEQVFPLLFVEQRRGWGGIQAQMPYFSGVSDVRRKSIEFLLDLDVGKLESERLLLRAREARLQEDWRSSVRFFNESIRGHGLITVNLPNILTMAWPPADLPMVAESRGNGWVDLDSLIYELSSELVDLESVNIPLVEPREDDAEDRLGRAIEEADELRQMAALIRDDMLRDRNEVNAIKERIEALREDLREHQDIVTLQRLGSVELERLHGDCPVCHQQLPPSLLGSEVHVQVTSPVDTVNYLRQQIELFEVMQRDGERTIAVKQEQWAALRERAAEARATIRALRATLTEPIGAPSIETITRRVRLDERVERLKSTHEMFYELLGRLDRLAGEARTVRAAIDQLPTDRLSDLDRQKLNFLQRSFIDQLREYDFGSFSDERLAISTNDYLPRREQFDLQADISASDSIRVVWAYLLGLMEVGRAFSTNHPGFLVFDEPRQQSAKTVSFAALLRRAAQDAEGKQIIFATSEELSSLEGMLDGLPHTLHAIDGYVLKRVFD